MYIQPNCNSVNMCGSEKNSGFWKRIKQIAMDMNFPSQSFMGKYFKEHVGMSPTEYRRS